MAFLPGRNVLVSTFCADKAADQRDKGATALKLYYCSFEAAWVTGQETARPRHYVLVRSAHHLPTHERGSVPRLSRTHCHESFRRRQWYLPRPFQYGNGVFDADRSGTGLCGGPNGETQNCYNTVGDLSNSACHDTANRARGAGSGSAGEGLPRTARNRTRLQIVIEEAQLRCRNGNVPLQGLRLLVAGNGK
jgi:hypothetical protein